MARAALPLAARFAAPLLEIYLNPRITAIHPTELLTRTVEDPLRGINREMARWMQAGHLDLGGVRVSDGLRRYRGRLLVVHSRGDGICDSASALSAVEHAHGPVEVLEVAHPAGERIGHADLFLCDVAPERVFRPIAQFLSSDP
jgi:pimeloyl-ACP methyl ester carboxylesterase